MAPTPLDLVALSVLLAGCGLLPPDPPAQPAVAADPDAALLHDWKIAGHVLGSRALVSDLDAAGFHGRGVAVSAGGYVSPWSGTCEQANRQKSARALAELTRDHDLAPGTALQLAEPITEYRLSCVTGTAPGMIVYVGGPHAVTCFAGVCYLLSR